MDQLAFHLRVKIELGFGLGNHSGGLKSKEPFQVHTEQATGWRAGRG